MIVRLNFDRFSTLHPFRLTIMIHACSQHYIYIRFTTIVNSITISDSFVCRCAALRSICLRFSHCKGEIHLFCKTHWRFHCNSIVCGMIQFSNSNDDNRTTFSIYNDERLICLLFDSLSFSNLIKTVLNILSHFLSTRKTKALQTHSIFNQHWFSSKRLLWRFLSIEHLCEWSSNVRNKMITARESLEWNVLAEISSSNFRLWAFAIEQLISWKLVIHWPLTAIIRRMHSIVTKASEWVNELEAYYGLRMADKPRRITLSLLQSNLHESYEGYTVLSMMIIHLQQLLVSWFRKGKNVENQLALALALALADSHTKRDRENLKSRPIHLVECYLLQICNGYCWFNLFISFCL